MTPVLKRDHDPALDILDQGIAALPSGSRRGRATAKARRAPRLR